MGVIADFNYSTFVALFPQFNYLSSGQVQFYWGFATSIHRNDGGGPVTDATLQANLLNLATAHIIQLLAPRKDGSAAPEMVGRINSAAQGSVNVSTEMLMASGSAQWWNQTPMGAMYWEMSKPFRSVRYLPGPAKPVAPWGVGGTTFIGQNWGGWGR